MRTKTITTNLIVSAVNTFTAAVLFQIGGIAGWFLGALTLAVAVLSFCVWALEDL